MSFRHGFSPVETEMASIGSLEKSMMISCHSSFVSKREITMSATPQLEILIYGLDHRFGQLASAPCVISFQPRLSRRDAALTRNTPEEWPKRSWPDLLITFNVDSPARALFSRLSYKLPVFIRDLLNKDYRHKFILIISKNFRS